MGMNSLVNKFYELNNQIDLSDFNTCLATFKTEKKINLTL